MYYMNNICPLTLLVQILHIVGGIDLDEEQMSCRRGHMHQCSALARSV